MRLIFGLQLSEKFIRCRYKILLSAFSHNLFSQQAKVKYNAVIIFYDRLLIIEI